MASNSSDRGSRQILKDTLGIVFFGTPHSGGDLNALSKMLHYAATGDPAAVIADHREDFLLSLQAVQWNFEALYSTKALQFKVASFYEELDTPKLGVVNKYPPKKGFPV